MFSVVLNIVIVLSCKGISLSEGCHKLLLCLFDTVFTNVYINLSRSRKFGLEFKCESATQANSNLT